MWKKLTSYICLVENEKKLQKNNMHNMDSCDNMMEELVMTAACEVGELHSHVGLPRRFVLGLNMDTRHWDLFLHDGQGLVETLFQLRPDLVL